MTRYSYLGPAGTFTERALLQVPGADAAQRIPVANVGEALRDVTEGRSDAAMIAVENSLEGVVTAAQDALATVPGLRILSEHLVPVSFVLVGAAGQTLEDAQVVVAHPVAYGQCLQWLAAHLPSHQHLPASSNVTAAHDLQPGQVALSTPTITDHVDVSVLATDVIDNPHAVTRFALVGRPGPLPARTGADKTSVIAELPSDAPGVLLEMLEQFATRGVNLSLIQSRPIGDRLGRYRFVLDLDGHVTDERVADALVGLKRFSPRVVFLGSYARADARSTEVHERYGDASFVEARDWLRGLLAGEPEA
ncbi:prephenate dehydratase [Agrococcus sp. SGAir0287]|uniref:prephenate dehydratase n=1 Tax=Agrococcus sp. SGAir0287 TaxID=2070347 RepID=UPI0010CCB7FA|nr:prephenate dehydratase [Agrococcus sp. SGAir0287]QCR18403.1 prephenate dehydratase [Agrococcus sp. SGAir0287]